jgi:hypothetical protein
MKLSELILEYVLTQDDMVKFYDDIKNEEEIYKKKPLKLKYRIAKKGEKVDTIINGEKETQNVTKDGDYVIIGVKGENYILSPDKVKEKYTIVDDETIATKPVKIKAKLYTGKDIQFKASWGENMILKSGDYLVKNNDEYYRIEKDAFVELYVRS